jgi:hypothetical protein
MRVGGRQAVFHSLHLPRRIRNQRGGQFTPFCCTDFLRRIVGSRFCEVSYLCIQLYVQFFPDFPAACAVVAYAILSLLWSAPLMVDSFS